MIINENIEYLVRYTSDEGTKYSKFSSHKNAMNYYEEKKEVYKVVSLTEIRTITTEKVLSVV